MDDEAYQTKQLFLAHPGWRAVFYVDDDSGGYFEQVPILAFALQEECRMTNDGSLLPLSQYSDLLPEVRIHPVIMDGLGSEIVAEDLDDTANFICILGPGQELPTVARARGYIKMKQELQDRVNVESVRKKAEEEHGPRDHSG